jgi:hypothetical protein
MKIIILFALLFFLAFGENMELEAPATSKSADALTQTKFTR